MSEIINKLLSICFIVSLQNRVFILYSGHSSIQTATLRILGGHMWAVATVLDSTGTRPMFLPFNALILSVTHVQFKELNSPTRFFVTNTVVHCSLWQTLSAPHTVLLVRSPCFGVTRLHLCILTPPTPRCERLGLSSSPTSPHLCILPTSLPLSSQCNRDQLSGFHSATKEWGSALPSWGCVA